MLLPENIIYDLLQGRKAVRDDATGSPYHAYTGDQELGLLSEELKAARAESAEARN